MAQVINDAGEVRHFAARVRESAAEVQTAARALESALTETRLTWRDARGDAAEHRIQAAVAEMNAFVRDAERTEEWLKQLAARIERYLQGGA